MLVVGSPASAVDRATGNGSGCFLELHWSLYFLLRNSFSHCKMLLNLSRYLTQKLSLVFFCEKMVAKEKVTLSFPNSFLSQKSRASSCFGITPLKWSQNKLCSSVLREMQSGTIDQIDQRSSPPTSCGQSFS